MDVGAEDNAGLEILELSLLSRGIGLCVKYPFADPGDIGEEAGVGGISIVLPL